MTYCDHIYQNYLAHHGILGMKWGIRRFQNEDGSLTKAGLRRYGSDQPFRSERESQTESRPNRRYSSAIDNPKVKKAVKTGAKVALAGLAVFGAYKLATHKFEIRDPDKIAKIISECNADFIADARRYGYPISFGGKFV